ncbi:MAG: tetratricopeptide repeat protein, partial [Acidobacteriia bacterium]|nr:tetratricopeptide repeat protein [Terriglobia bacterium]
QIGFDGKQTNTLEKEIHFVMGSGNHVRAYLSRTGRGTYVELPLAWYAENGGYWAMNPGYDRPDHPGFRRNITYGCMFCHNGIPEIPSGNQETGAEPVFTGRMPEGIDCQRCHGPGSRHAEEAARPGVSVEQLRKSIVNPARLSPAREMEVCLQCHLQTTSSRLPSSILRYDRAPFSYRPGEPLADFSLQFDRASGNPRFEIAGAAYRLRQSLCFQKSGDALHCTTCHNPHDVPRGEGAAEHYRRVCEGCHAAALKSVVASGKHTDSRECISCHMPKRRTDDAVHVVMTDHYIQRQKPARDLLAPIAEQAETQSTTYQGEVILYYPPKLPEVPESELYRDIAQVSQNNNLKEGTARLAAAIDRYKPERMEYYLQLADAWESSDQPGKALSLYDYAVHRKPDSFVALRKLGFGLRSAGQFGRAADTLKQALARAPQDASTWHELGLTYLNLGLKSDAAASFQKAIEFDPDMAEAYNSLGGMRLESRDPQAAEAPFREAIRLQPDYAEAHSNLGNLLSSVGRFDESKYHFELATRLKPDYSAARFNYAIALARVKRFGEAQHQVETLLQSSPSNVEALDLLGSLLVATGEIRAAVDRYQAAIRIRPDFARAQLDLGAALADLRDVAGALPHIRAAAGSTDPAIKQEALQMLQQLGQTR